MTIGYKNPFRSAEQINQDREQSTQTDATPADIEVSRNILGNAMALLGLSRILRGLSDADEIVALERTIADIRTEQNQIRVPTREHVSHTFYPSGFNSAMDPVHPMLPASLVIERPTPIASLYAIDGGANEHTIAEAPPLRISA